MATVALIALIGRYLTTSALLSTFAVPAPEHRSSLEPKGTNMPLIDFYTHPGATSAEDRQKISDAVHAAMREILGIPKDDRFHFFHEFAVGDLFHDDVIFSATRSDRLIFVTFSFDERPAEVKAALFESALTHLEAVAGWHRDEVMFRVLETGHANWWASGRVVDPNTGYDERMTNV